MEGSKLLSSSKQKDTLLFPVFFCILPFVFTFLFLHYIYKFQPGAPSTNYFLVYKPEQSSLSVRSIFAHGIATPYINTHVKTLVIVTTRAARLSCPMFKQLRILNSLTQRQRIRKLPAKEELETG